MKPTQEQIDAVEEKCRIEDESIILSYLQRIPPSWTLIEKYPGGGAFRRGNIQVIVSILKYEDANIWIHVSLTGRNNNGFHFPEWEDIKRVKNDFIGENKWAYQVFPPLDKYVNHHPTVLHLYALLEDNKNVLPDFTWGLGIL